MSPCHPESDIICVQRTAQGRNGEEGFRKGDQAYVKNIGDSTAPCGVPLFGMEKGSERIDPSPIVAVRPHTKL